MSFGCGRRCYKYCLIITAIRELNRHVKGTYLIYHVFIPGPRRRCSGLESEVREVNNGRQ